MKPRSLTFGGWSICERRAHIRAAPCECQPETSPGHLHLSFCVIFAQVCASIRTTFARSSANFRLSKLPGPSSHMHCDKSEQKGSSRTAICNSWKFQLHQLTPLAPSTNITKPALLVTLVDAECTPSAWSMICRGSYGSLRTPRKPDIPTF